MLRDALRGFPLLPTPTAGIFSLGSDDFVIVIDDFKEESEMYSLADKVFASFAIPFPLGDAPYEVSCRIGLVACTEYLRGEQTSPGDMLRYGELAGRLAKKTQGVFRLDMESYLSAMKELDMEVVLINSIKNCELKVVYQPVYSYGPDRITSVEALIRWENERYGNVPPPIHSYRRKVRFHKPARRFCDRCVLDLASKLCSEGRDIRVNFNVSSLQFSQSSFAEKLTEKFRSAAFRERRRPRDNGIIPLRRCLRLYRKAGNDQKRGHNGLHR